MAMAAGVKARPSRPTLVLILAFLASCAAQTSHVKCETTAGSFTAVVDRSLSPQGVDRFLELVQVQLCYTEVQWINFENV